MSRAQRRFFWGHSLAQAVVSAARWYGLAPERLAYRVHDKRHGFVRLRRPVLIRVDPEALERAPGAEAPAAPKAERTEAGRAPARRDPPARSAAPEPRTRGASAKPRSSEPRSSESRRASRPGPRRAPSESWSSPDDDSELAAAEAAGRLLRLAGLELEARVARGAERFEIELGGADEARLAELGVRFLDDLDHLLPRAIHGLCGRLVRTRIEGAGLRAAREEELRARARAIAERVAASGEEELTEPLDPAERRIVHLELAESGAVATESLGSGLRKRVRISPAGGPA